MAYNSFWFWHTTLFQLSCQVVYMSTLRIGTPLHSVIWCTELYYTFIAQIYFFSPSCLKNVIWSLCIAVNRALMLTFNCTNKIDEELSWTSFCFNYGKPDLSELVMKPHPPGMHAEWITHLSLRFDAYYFAILYNDLLNWLVEHVGSSIDGT